MGAVTPTTILMVEVPAPGCGIGLGLKLTDTPPGCPEADNVMALANPLDTVVVIVDVPLLPCCTLTDVGEADMVKDTDAVVTVSVTVTLFVAPPPVPVTVMG